MPETLAAIATQLLFIVFPGLVLHRALAVRMLAMDQAKSATAEIPESDLLIYGLLPGLAIANTVGTVLAIFGQFRTPIFAAVMVALTLWRWRDAAATLGALRQQVRIVAQSLSRGELMVLIAVAILLETAFGLMVNAQIPSANIDVWHHNYPLAQSIVSHSGFVLPQIPGMFYGTYPIFFHMFFAEGLLFIDHVIAAKVINSIIYLSFLLSLLFCAHRARAITVLALMVLIINDRLFSNGAEDAMTDVPRVCFSVLAFTFAYRYLRDGRCYFLLASGLLAGGAVAGKYTELLLPFLIGISLLPRMAVPPKQFFNKSAWTHIAIYSAAVVVVGCYPYLRNLILLHNPIYPFVFAHPGLTDEYMAAINAEIYTHMDPVYRNYVTNLLSLQGWHDFLSAVYEFFLGPWRHAALILVLIGVGVILPGSFLIYAAFYTFALAIIWYVAMFSSPRWGLPAYMMTLTTAFLTVAWVIDRAVIMCEPAGRDWRALKSRGLKDSWLMAIPWLSPNNLVRAGLALVAVAFAVVKVEQSTRQGWSVFLPKWINKDQARAVIGAPGVDAYLANTRPDYMIYRYIGDHNLKMVLQPFDNGSSFYQAAYNGGRDGNWLLPWYSLPKEPPEFSEFLRANNVRYFVYRPKIGPVEAERLDHASANQDHVQRAYELLRQLLPRSQRILVDPFGCELYALDDAPVPAR